MQIAVERGWCINLGGGMHHASHNQGGGWCIFADILLSLRHARLALSDRVDVAMVIDLDVHQVAIAQRTRCKKARHFPTRCNRLRRRATRCDGDRPRRAPRNAMRSLGLADAISLRPPPALSHSHDKEPNVHLATRHVQGNGVARDKLSSRDERLYIVDMYNRDVYPNDAYAQRGVDYPVCAALPCSEPAGLAACENSGRRIRVRSVC